MEWKRITNEPIRIRNIKLNKKKAKKELQKGSRRNERTLQLYMQQQEEVGNNKIKLQSTKLSICL